MAKDEALKSPRVDSAESTLGDFKASSFAKEDIARGDTNVFKEDLSVAVRRIIEAEDRQVP